MKNEQKFDEEINLLLNEVSDTCHKFAHEIDRDFYVFQTPIIYNPDLLIIGINPGGGKSYTKARKEKNYEKRPANDLYYTDNTLTTKPEWEIDAKLQGSDILRNRLGRVFNTENNLDILERSVMMNMIYFNSEKAHEIFSLSPEIIEYCLNTTQKFVEVINPKNILFLTSNNWSLSKCGVKGIKSLGNNIKEGKLNNRTVYAIPHYGYYSAYSHVNSELMGKKLAELFTV